MHIELMLQGFNEFGWKVCDTCPCHRGDEFGMGCNLGYFENSKGYENGWINIDTGNSVMGLTEEPPDEPGTWYTAWLRPLECIDEHGR